MALSTEREGWHAIWFRKSIYKRVFQIFFMPKTFCCIVRTSMDSLLHIVETEHCSLSLVYNNTYCFILIHSHRLLYLNCRAIKITIIVMLKFYIVYFNVTGRMKCLLEFQLLKAGSCLFVLQKVRSDCTYLCTLLCHLIIV